MSIADDFNATASIAPGSSPVPPVTSASSPQRLHRIAEVRQQQGVSVRSAARRLGVTMEQARQQEKSTSDIRLSELYQWQKAMEVPVADLLVDADAPLSGPVLTRARMLRVMKTVRAIQESSDDSSTHRLASMLESQLLELMPELSTVSAWHSVGQRRTQDELGRIAEQPISDNFARDALH